MRKEFQLLLKTKKPVSGPSDCEEKFREYETKDKKGKPQTKHKKTKTLLIWEVDNVSYLPGSPG